MDPIGLDELAELHSRALQECSEREAGSVHGAFFRLAEALDTAHALLYREQAERSADELTKGLKDRLQGTEKAKSFQAPTASFKVRPKTSQRSCPQCGSIMWRTEVGWECNEGHRAG